MTLFILMALAAYRLFRLVALDTITEPARKRFKPDGKMGLFISCPWCAGAWISFGTVAVTAQCANVPLPILQALAVSCVVGFLGGFDGE